jgi:two-component system LytT family response regulator
VQLSDGLSLELFRHVAVTCPVVFTTAYDAYVLDAFDCNSIDYLLKPVKHERLAQALQKYDRLRRHFAGDVANILRQTESGRRTNSFKRRLIVQKGTSYVAIDTSSVRYGFSEDKITFVVDAQGRRYLCEDALTTLEEQLDPSEFFRLNRKYIARIDAIGSFRSASRGRVWVDLVPAAPEEVVVSQEKAARFKDWLGR